MRVTIRDIDTLMPNTVGNRQSRKTHINQQTYVAVTKVMNPYALYPGRLAAPIHLVVEIVLADGENPTIRLYALELLEIILHLLTQKLRHCYNAVALFCLGRCDDILTIQPLVRFIDANRFVCKVEVRWSESQKLTLTDSAPVKHLKCVVGQRLIC